MVHAKSKSETTIMIRAIDVAAQARAAAAPNHLARAAFVCAVAKAESRSPAELFKRLFPQDEVSPGILARSTAPLGTTTGSGFADHLVQTAVAEFWAALAPESAAAALMRQGGLVLDATAGDQAINIPIRPADPAAPGWIPEGAPIAVRQYALNTVALGPARQIGAIVVSTRTLLKRSDAARVFVTMLREDAARGLDGAVFSSETGSGDAIAGLLDGATEVSGTGDPLRDMQRLANSVCLGGSGQVTFIAGRGLAATINLDSRIEAQVLPSAAVAEDRLIAVDPRSLAWGADDRPDITVSTSALVHMSDTALPIVDSGTADPVRGLWQTNSIATRLILNIAFAKRRAAAVAFTDGVDYLS
jgi:hypothetical protein